MNLLIAQRAYPEKTLKLQEAFRDYRTSPGDSTFSSAGNLIIILGIIVLLLLIISKILQRNSKAVAARNPRRFFARILRQLGAGLVDRLLLHQAAHHAELPQPAMMLLSPELFDRYAFAWADTLRIDFLRDRVRARFQSIANRAFNSSN